MVSKIKKLRRRIRVAARKIWRHPRTYIATAVVISAVVVAYTSSITNQQLSVDPSTCKPLLGLIAQAESKGNYNAYFGNAGNASIMFTKMSVADVLKWQQEFVANGNASSAVGRYQIISSTLEGLVQQLHIDVARPFDEGLQDTLAITLLERRGVTKYVNNQINREQFAAELAKEWAALPKVMGDQPEQSYYAGDGLNKALVSVSDVLHAIGSISAASAEPTKA